MLNGNGYSWKRRSFGTERNQNVTVFFGIVKLNTTAYHPECDGMVER